MLFFSFGVVSQQVTGNCFVATSLHCNSLVNAASRMAANVASGVGFVGAGVITTSMRDQEKGNQNNPQSNVVHGLTTAATIW